MGHWQDMPQSDSVFRRPLISARVDGWNVGITHDVPSRRFFILRGTGLIDKYLLTVLLKFRTATNAYHIISRDFSMGVTYFAWTSAKWTRGDVALGAHWLLLCLCLHV